MATNIMYEIWFYELLSIVDITIPFFRVSENIRPFFCRVFENTLALSQIGFFIKSFDLGFPLWAWVLVVSVTLTLQKNLVWSHNKGSPVHTSMNILFITQRLIKK
jgi:hypothetical protein